VRGASNLMKQTLKPLHLLIRLTALNSM